MPPATVSTAPTFSAAKPYALACAQPTVMPALPKPVAQAFATIKAAAKNVDAYDFDRCLGILALDPDLERRAASFLLNKKHSLVTNTDVTNLATATPNLEQTLYWLTDWSHRQAANAAVARLHASLGLPLRAALLATSQSEYFWPAIDRIENFKRSDPDGSDLVDFLKRYGCLEQNEHWKLLAEFTPGSDPVAALAERPTRPAAPTNRRLERRPAYILAARCLVRAGHSAHASWTKAMLTTLDAARGHVGEALRLVQLAKVPEYAGLEAVQGALVYLAPKSVWSSPDLTTAIANAQAEGLTGKVANVSTTTGRRFGILITEVDAAILDARGPKLKLVRVDNVKAGVGEAATARQQNEKVLQTLASGHGHFLVPNNGGYLDVAAQLDCQPAALHAVATDTCGPADGQGYSQSLELTEVEISALARDFVRHTLHEQAQRAT